MKEVKAKMMRTRMMATMMKRMARAVMKTRKRKALPMPRKPTSLPASKRCGLSAYKGCIARHKMLLSAFNT